MGRFAFLQERDRSFRLLGDLSVKEHQVELGETLRVRLRLGLVLNRPAPTGTVTFTSNGRQIGGTHPVIGGRVNASLPTEFAGDQTIVADYSGDALHPAGGSESVLVDVYAPTSTVLTAPDAPTGVGETWSGSVRVTAGAESVEVPWGTVRLTFDGVDRGTVELDAEGVAAFSFDGLAAGRHRLEATYEGNYWRFLGQSTLTVRHRVTE